MIHTRLNKPWSNNVLTQHPIQALPALSFSQSFLLCSLSFRAPSQGGDGGAETRGEAEWEIYWCHFDLSYIFKFYL